MLTTLPNSDGCSYGFISDMSQVRLYNGITQHIELKLAYFPSGTLLLYSNDDKAFFLLRVSGHVEPTFAERKNLVL